LADEWDGPVTVEEAKELESVLLGPLKAVSAAVSSKADLAEISASLQGAVNAFNKVYPHG
jgi:hypothetical protein